MTEPSAKFRHDLRTPLNHIIGYGEILSETLADAGLGEEDSARQALTALIVRTRSLVQSLQNLPEENLAAGAKDAVRKANLLAEVDRLPGLLDAEHAPDLERMHQAALQLLALANGTGTHTDAPGGVNAPKSQGTAGAVLVVDDDDANRELLRRMLERQSYSVTAAAGGPECLELMGRSQFDVVLLDVLMPGMNGFDVLSRIRASAELRTTPVIVISALDESSAAIRCIQMGAEDYLPKPFDTVLLKARIGATLEKKRLRDQEAKYAKDLENALSELHGAKDKLVVQEKLASLGALTAGIAHELKNPLNFITNFASLSREASSELSEELAKPEPDREEIRDLLKTLQENLERVESHGKRADRIVRGMLLHSHGQPGRREPADINVLVEEAIGLSYHGVRAHDSSFNVTIEKEFANGLPLIPVTPQDLSRVLVNILDNAFYAVNEKKKTADAATSGQGYVPVVRMITRDAGENIEVVLEDNGNGIGQAAVQKIFDPFFTTKPAGIGTGLGLSISYDIVVRGHEGSLNVESEAGRFARFRILLPKAPRGLNAA